MSHDDDEDAASDKNDDDDAEEDDNDDTKRVTACIVHVFWALNIHQFDGRADSRCVVNFKTTMLFSVFAFKLTVTNQLTN